MKRIVTPSVLAFFACLLLVGPLSAQKETTQKTGFDVTVYSHHFVKNTVTPEENGTFLVIQSIEEFEEYFGYAAVMPMPKFVTAETFKTQVVFAVIRDGLWEFEDVSAHPYKDGPVLRYSAKKQETKTWHAVSCLVVAIEKAAVGPKTIVTFVENDKEVAKVEVAAPQDKVISVGDVPGAWSKFKVMDRPAAAIFAKMKKERPLVGAEYWPVAYAIQTVNGTNYCFFCNSKVVVPKAPYAPVFIVIPVKPDGEIGLPNIQPLEIPAPK